MDRDVHLADRQARDRARDVDLLSSGWQPGACALAGYPVIDHWDYAFSPVDSSVSLVGLVTGHPTLPGHERVVMTTPVVQMDEKAGWARTMGRFYRLGARSGVDA